MRRRVAIVGADSPVGEALLQALQDLARPPEAIVPVSLGEAEGCVTWLGEDLPCQTPDRVDWSAVDAVVVATQAAAAARLVERLRTPPRPVVAVSGLMPETPDMPLIVVDDAATAALLRVLQPLLAGQPPMWLAGFIGLPVAAHGQEGIEELARQSRALFALEAAEAESFPVQIAYNLLPQVGDIGPGGSSAFETRLIARLRQALGTAAPLQFTAAWLPTFHGAVVDLHGCCASVLDLAAAKARIRHVPGILSMDADYPGGAPTPATDAVDSTDVALGRLRLSPQDGHCFSLWLTFDFSRLQAQQLCEGLEKMIESGPD
ncbi:MAG: Asd/ArgC dimerization domain-containing protein [Thiobacillaceae bacterium]